jgi:hypothetical protein
MSTKHKGIYARGKKLWMGLRIRPGEWKYLPTNYRVGQEVQAAELRRLTQQRLDAGAEFTDATGGPPTVQSFGRSFLGNRRKLGVRSVDDDESRLRTHVYPALGAMRLDEVQPRHVAGLIAKVRQDASPRAPFATSTLSCARSSAMRRSLGSAARSPAF